MNDSESETRLYLHYMCIWVLQVALVVRDLDRGRYSRSLDLQAFQPHGIEKDVFHASLMAHGLYRRTTAMISPRQTDRDDYSR